MKLLLTLLLTTVSTTPLSAAPDPRDSVILESKTAAPQSGPCASAILKVRVYITNKDSLANIVFPFITKTISGSAYAILARPASCGARALLSHTFNFLYPPGPGGGQRLPTRSVNYREYHSNSPDSFLLAFTLDDPANDDGKIPPNPTRVLLGEIKFDSLTGLGAMNIDSGRVFGGHVLAFTLLAGNVILVNFAKSIITVCDSSSIPVISNCPAAPINVLYGRPFTYDFNTSASVPVFSVLVGPGSIDRTTGVYTFSDQCPLGPMPITIQVKDSASADTLCSIGYCNFIINVVDNPPSCSPQQIAIFVPHGTLAANQVNASDPDPDFFIFSQIAGPGTISANGSWSYQTSCADVSASPQTVRVKVADGFGGCIPGPLNSACEFQLFVVNFDPTIANCPLKIVSTDSSRPFSLQLNAIDSDSADSGNLIFSRISGPTGLTVSPSGLVQWTPSPSQTGVFSACLQVTDLCGGFSRCCINFNTIKGDLNQDGALTAADVILSINCIFLGIIPPAGAAACDLNCDGIATAADFVLILNTTFLGDPFPC